jgi:hypothetical protein
MSDKAEHDPHADHPTEAEEKPHPLAMMILVLFPFLLMLLIALLFSWLTG